jgi:hypothetical protein
MATLLHDCPHCGARGAAFTIVFTQIRANDSTLFNMFGACPLCSAPIAATCLTGGNDPKSAPGAINAWPVAKDIRVFPVKLASSSPEYVPAAAAKAFIEGAESLKDRRATAAIAMFRRTIDVATKQYSDAVEAGNLAKRIDKLANAGLITKDLQTWAHKIRLEGNGALHEIDEPSVEQATELEHFTEMMLVYMFTLPAKVKANLAVAEE